MFPTTRGEWFRFEAFGDAFIDGRDISVNVVCILKGDMEDFQNVGEQFRVGQGKIVKLLWSCTPE